VEVTGDENVKKIVFRAYFRQTYTWIDLCQTKTKMITCPYTYRRIHFTSGNASLLWYFVSIIREGAACHIGHLAVLPVYVVETW